jgi:hypothetical protein
VKFHWKPKAGVHSLVWEEAQLIAGTDPDFHRRDLAEAIEAGARDAAGIVPGKKPQPVLKAVIGLLGQHRVWDRFPSAVEA